ncbi:CBS domain-containing protein [Saccharopolyspora elongata]|uniref:CBS domain-containing protein n=1 Tax=Saccharopolyspora elongata TaxID=2530387 RepID=A0A4V2YKZ0_9PSEU|nr:hypothetical protein [Saccharopolyspora elongata]TDD44287.1 hypothetical protein E1288_24525 [Saccharopolyspora elongata]
MTVQASALDLASTPVVAVRPELDATDDIGLAAQRVIDAHTDAVLVMRDGRVRGVLTGVDLVRSLARTLAAQPEEEGSR